MSAPTSKSRTPAPGFTASDFSPHATGTAAEAWALIAQMFFIHGRPRIMEVGQELDLSPPQTIVLRSLDEPRPMGELAGVMRCDSSNITGIVDRLEARGLVQRQPSEHDRRVKMLVVTDEGAELRDQLLARMYAAPEALAALPPDDQRALRDLLRRAAAGR